MCVDFAIHDTDSGNPHCHIMLTMRPLDERGAWAAKSKKKYDLDDNGERIRLPSGRYKTHKVDLTGWNDKDNTLRFLSDRPNIKTVFLCLDSDEAGNDACGRLVKLMPEGLTATAFSRFTRTGTRYCSTGQKSQTGSICGKQSTA